jgi:class 3 adenylate cyclase/AmiR/NasT family two-component response regulator
MHAPPRILIVDDNDANRDILEQRLTVHGYQLLQAADGEEALAVAREHRPDLILLDIMMPKLDGIEVCRRLKSDPALPFTSIILITARTDSKDVVAGLDAGADEYLTKPVDQTALVARVKSMLRLKELHDRVVAQAADLASWNRTLEQRVADQVGELERVGRLKRFLSPQIAEMIVSSGNDQILESHRREITVVVCDLRGFTAFSEAAAPEEVMAVLREYQSNLGLIIDKFEGTVERFTGDGLMVWFNDPLPCADPCARAARMAIEMRDRVAALAATWRRRDHVLGFSIGMAHGYATLGRIGFERRFDYAAVGTVVNLAARLCAEAKDGQILIDAKVQAAVEDFATAERVGDLALKGFHRPIKAFNLTAVR